MKFTWFNLMPWPYLPDDFREQNRSVWVDIPNTLYDPRKGHFVYHEYMDQLEYAEALGFDGIGVNEHHQNGYGLMPSPNLIAAGLCRRTSRPALCVIGNSIALHNPPIRVADEFAILHVLSGGPVPAGARRSGDAGGPGWTGAARTWRCTGPEFAGPCAPPPAPARPGSSPRRAASTSSPGACPSSRRSRTRPATGPSTPSSTAPS